MRKKRTPEISKSRISICAPGFSFSKQDFLKGVVWLESMGIQPDFPPELFQKKGRLAGSDTVRAEGLLRSVKESDIILAARGGGGCGRLFPLVKRGMKSLKPFSRTFVGSSDCTFLYLFAQALSPQSFVYAPMVCRYGSGEFKGFEKKTIAEILKGTLEFPLQYPKGFFTEKEGRAIRGKLDGGNLSILVASLGTPYEWSPKGSILYLEDVNEPLYRIDRMLTQLSHAGKFRKIQAVLVGKMLVSGKTIPRRAWRECLMEHFGKIRGPVITQIPTGHGKTQWPFFLGGDYLVDGSITCLKLVALKGFFKKRFKLS